MKWLEVEGLLPQCPIASDATGSLSACTTVMLHSALQGKLSAENYLGKLSVADCEDLLCRYAPRTVDRQTLPPLQKLAF